MSQAIPVQSCSSCDCPPTTAVPGPSGAAGAAGDDGCNGINATTFTTANFTQPASAANVTANVVNSEWLVAGQDVYVENGGYYLVNSKPTTTSVSLKNRGYVGNAAPAAIIPSGSQITPAGPKGIDGSAGAGALLIVNNLSDVASVATSRTNLGLGTVAVENTVPVAKGGTGATTAAGARTNLSAAASGLATASGLTSSATDKVIGRSTAGAGALEEIPCTSFGRSLIAAANAAAVNTLLGTSTFPYLLYQHQQATTVDGGSFNNAAWRTVPITTEVADTGNNGSLAANVMTLAAGTYRFEGWMTAYSVDGFQCRLFNSDTASVLQYGQCSDTGGASTGTSSIAGRFTLAAPNQLILQAQCVTTQATTGFGKALSFGGTEVYGSLTFWKEG